MSEIEAMKIEASLKVVLLKGRLIKFNKVLSLSHSFCLCKITGGHHWGRHLGPTSIYGSPYLQMKLPIIMKVFFTPVYF